MQKELEELQPKLVETQRETEEKEKIVAQETADAEVIQERVAADEAVAKESADKANGIKTECEKELEAAMPALIQAEKALNCITKADIAVLKKLPNPPPDAKMVLDTVCILFGQKADRKMDPNTQKAVYDYWPIAVKMMNQDDFLRSI